jgi:leucyl aminopeptidase
MKFIVEQKNITEIKADAVIVNLFEGVTELSGVTASLDAQMNGTIVNLISAGEFKGKLNETTVLYPQGLNARKVVVVGLGKAEALTVEKVRQAAGSAIKLAAKGKTSSVATVVHGAEGSGLSLAQCAQAVVEGTLMATYRYDKLKRESSPMSLEQIIIAEQGSILEGVNRGEIMAEATLLARDLVSAPGNYMTPTHMAEVAQQIAADTGLECTILERSDMEKLGMGSLLGVAQGSAQPPKMIVLKYNGEPGGDTLALVGKGLTFDSGGISLKPGEGMELMKNDMGGGAAVLGAMQAVGKLKPSKNVLGIVACTENMPSGSALKPGDVITAMNGKTIEIINTDAEGRLILADAVAYANTLGAKRIVDAATLTGACGIALGPNIYTAVVANDDTLVADIMAAARLTGERYWQMPGDDDYKELIKSPVADIKNTGGRLGGVMTGGLFIGEFAGNTPWAHLDIAPTCWTETEKPYQPKGATGVAVRTLAELACR